MKKPSKAVSSVALGLILACAASARFMPGWYWDFRTANPVRTGAKLATREGCLSCHAPLGRSEHANPGSRGGSVPSFFRGNAMMYAPTKADVESFIEKGSPSPATVAAHEHGEGKAAENHPFMMPAFGDRLDRRQIQALAAFVLAADGLEVPDESPVAKGFELSRRFGCESCHGMGGSGGVRNPRSFTGSVASWTGPDFPHLVKDKQEFSEWVLKGRSPRWKASRPASFFLDRANLKMPAFKGALSQEDVEALWAYVQWLRTEEWARDARE